VPKRALLVLYEHPLSTCNIQWMIGSKHLLKPGRHLRARRLSLNLTLRDVHRASLRLAQELRNPAFVIPPSRSHDIETKTITPNIHRLYTLAHIYGFDLRELLGWYGVPRG
jgi:hypothetical protein